LEEEPSLTYSSDSANLNSTDSLWISDYQTDTIKIALTVSSNKILVLSDTYFESWHATIDGTSAEILRANGAFRAVEIPAGSQEIIFHYQSEKYETGKTFTYATTGYIFLVMIGFFLFGHKKEEDFTESL